MKLSNKDIKTPESTEFRILNNRVGLFNSSYQDHKKLGLPKAQLILTDIPYCYDVKTECFTRNGWRHYNEITMDDEVLSLNHETQEMEYSGIENIIVRDCDEPMISFSTPDLNLFVSSKHRCYTIGKFIPNLKYGERMRNRKRIYVENIRIAENITEASSIPRSGYKWSGGNIVDYVEIPSVKIKHNGKTQKYHMTQGVKVDTISWLRFFGLWLADGCTTKSGSGYIVSIKQHNNNRDKVIEILNALPFDYSEHQSIGENTANYNIYSKQLYSYLSQFGKSRDKFIPRWILDLPKDYLTIFWEAYTFGDSHPNGQGIRISSMSKNLIIGLQEVALKLGTICQIRTKETKTGTLYYFQYNPKSRNIKYGKRKIVDGYNDLMWCLTLKRNSVFLVRRNGLICFSGNCIGANAYGSNPTWYKNGDNKNGESDYAGETFFVTDENFKPAEFMHFAAQMLKPEPKEKSGRTSSNAPCMIVFCEFMQQFYLIELAKRYGFNHYINLVFRKNYSAQVLKANMKIVGNCEYGLVLYRDKLPKFNNNGQMVFNCMDWSRDLGMPKIAPTQKPIPLLKRLIELFTDVDDVVIDPCAGSSSTLVAAASLGRKAYGFEVSKRFYVDACDALKNNIHQDLFNESIEEKKRREYTQQKLNLQ